MRYPKIGNSTGIAESNPQHSGDGMRTAISAGNAAATKRERVGAAPPTRVDEKPTLEERARPRVVTCSLCGEAASSDRILVGDVICAICEHCVTEAVAAIAEARKALGGMFQAVNAHAAFKAANSDDK
jgi:hypothetical protein